MFFQTKILDNTLEKISKNINKNLIFTNNKTYTVNGRQTINIFSYIPENIINEILFFNNFDKKLFHLHFINYEKGGYQEPHNHVNTEKYSFILYLNDSDGDTIFLINNKKIAVKPQKGKLVVFSSDIMHYALKSFKNKKILVGAIDKI
tara:strand:- start:59 stop:502 length:444 start_codon:yes stop_codon:yes gene_type:complete